jgi:hypothetical protein
MDQQRVVVVLKEDRKTARQVKALESGQFYGEEVAAL